METVREAKVAPGSPGMGKKGDFLCAISASLGEQGHNGKSRTLGRVGEPEDYGRKKEKALKQMGGPALWKPAVLIRVLLNGKRFWTNAERFHTTVDACQAEVREKHC